MWHSSELLRPLPLIQQEYVVHMYRNERIGGANCSPLWLANKEATVVGR